MPLEHTLSCRKLLTHKQAFSFLFPRKNESISRKKKCQNIIDLGLDLLVFQRVENRVVKVRNACVENGFSVRYSII